MPHLLTAAVGVWVFAGARHESKANNGIAHFLEHMAFKGTASRTALQIAEQIEDVGGYINAYTSRESTAYYTRVRGQDVGLSIELIADILQNPRFEVRDIESERTVVLQEIGQTNDTPDDIIFDWLQETAYPDQSLGRNILGTPENVSRFAQSDLREFVETRYRPDQMVLSAAGSVDHDAIVLQAQQLFGDLNCPSTPDGFEPARFVSGQHMVQKPLEQVHFAFALEGPRFSDSDFYAAQIYASIMGGGMSSRLFQTLREERGLCYTVFAQAGPFLDTGMMTFYAGTSPNDINELILVTGDEIRRAAASLDETELNRARVQINTGLLMGLESPSNRAERLARLLQIWNAVPDVNETIDKLNAVTLDQLHEFALDLATNRPAAMTVYGEISNVANLDELRGRMAA